jgi:hypothetical protein
MLRVISCVLLLMLILVPLTLAQDNIVPDLTGLNVPQAAARLNAVGARLGLVSGEPWTAESGLPQNSVAAQSVPPDTAIEYGTVVDLLVLRSPNALLIYDDNDLTLVNQTGTPISLNGITFRALDGNQAAFNASRWSQALREDRCAQVWSVGRNGPKGLDECRFIEHWLVTGNSGEHFWTGAGGTTQFALLQDGVERARCPVANPGTCEFYLSAEGTGGDVTEYVYFAYTEDRLAVINTSEDRWMPLAGLVVRNNYVPPLGAAVNIASPDLFGNPNTVATIERLAPGQCLLFTNSSPEAQTPPQPCDVVARLDVGPSVIFWGAEFPVESITDSAPRSCPAATPGSTTLCILPR